MSPTSVDDHLSEESPTPTINGEGLQLHHIPSHVSAHDIPIPMSIHATVPATPTKTKTIDDSIYDRLPPHRKHIITCILSVCGFLAPISSTTVLSAIPEVAGTYHTTGSIINVSNAVYLVFMGLSPCFWAPMSQVYGRRWICLSSAFLFFACSLGTALSPNLAAFFIFRALTAFQGTSFLIVGASCLGDIYRPVERATAMGWFLSGTLIGPAIGPFIAGVIVTYRSWRVIFFLQAALGGLATVLVFFFLPETIHFKRSDELVGLSRAKTVRMIWEWTNPIRVVKLYKYPNLIVASLASSALVWNMYSLLTPIRYIINPRFGLTTPIQSGLFYLAPGMGYITGTFMGGRYADYIVKKWIVKRNGERVPEDRLRSCVPFLGGVIPGCMLIYGWSLEKKAGGVALPIIVMFLQGCAQLFCFPSLNTYCLDVMQSRSAEVVAGNYMVRYFFAAAGSAVVLPAVQVIGVGWFSTITAVFLVFSALAVYCTAVWGQSWRDWADRRGAGSVATTEKAAA
ncbi:Major facilitator superfamily transporter protein [Mycena indigotica]|uniref:Major facilitator superfamily transporter protein n=1 Tax=Mycena indigotica TaxID=2126181 RepID=A0A8H6S7Y4_9AGAR|nr:Major facilitator superfamily transporter protein [Mycena indigotica]KAF7294529.1 Major facilitator superfamily transporter protein [Mycena indigotica]